MKLLPKYNPSFQTNAEIIDSFVVRHSYLDLMIETLRENTGSVNQHLLIVGARGSGKTTLVQRIAAAIAADPDLQAHWFAIPFAEESYQVMSVGEFWLEALFHLGDLTQDPRWEKIGEELREERNEKRLQERALSQLLDFADREGKRILLMVENLNMLLSEQMSSDSDWDLRHTLQTESRLMLLGTATSRFEEIDHIDKAWFEFFSVYTLKPLDLPECRSLWQAITGEDLSEHRLRPMQILTGGNPRLLRILAEFAAQKSLRELMDNLTHLIDEHTEYFKSQLDHLAALERKVFVVLLDAWDPLSAREVADIARIDVNKASSLLNRLVSKGAITILDENKRKKIYQISERLFNIYYLMRRRGHPSNRIRAVVDFLISFYKDEELVQFVSQLATEACDLDPFQRSDHVSVYHTIRTRMAPELQLKLERSMPDDFLRIPEVTQSGTDINTLQQQVNALIEETKQHYLSKRYEKALQTIDQTIHLQPTDFQVWFNRGKVLAGLGRMEEAIDSYDQAIRIQPDLFQTWSNRGVVLARLGRLEEAIDSFDKAIRFQPASYPAWNNLGLALSDLGRHEGAIDSYEQAIRIEPDFYQAWYNRGLALSALGRHEEAINSYEQAIRIEPDFIQAWNNRGLALSALGRHEEAIHSYDQAIRIESDFYQSWSNRGNALNGLGSHEEAIHSYDQAIWIQPDDTVAWYNRGVTLSDLLVQNEAVDSGFWAKILKWLSPSIDAVSVIGDLLPITTELLINVAAAGHAAELLDLIQHSQAAMQLESLSIGIQLFLGQPTQVAQEIYEIGKDVAQRIRDRQKQLAPSVSPTNP